jgi:1,4-alpha-glucan branching enzyme
VAHGFPVNRPSLALILHAHLPWVRHPEHERFLEESWFYEAMAECYLPLLRVLGGWVRDRVPARITVSVSPTLGAMLEDPLLRGRFRRWLEARLELAEQETFRTRWLGPVNAVAQFYHARFGWMLGLWDEIGGDVLKALRALADAGVLEPMTCAGTHGLLPFLVDQPGSLHAQTALAQAEFRRWFGRASTGLWLPECSYAPGIEHSVREAGFRWLVVETHGLHHASPVPPALHLAPAVTPEGLAVVARDPESARQVWSRDTGYPGDPVYRDFYHDIGFELDADYVDACLPAPGIRGFTGIKYSRITGPTDAKEPYDRATALERVRVHAEHFVESRLVQLAEAAKHHEIPLLVTAPYDAELFGHWWFEGPEFIDAVGRIAAVRGLDLVTPTQFLAEHPQQALTHPAASSWGEHGYWRLWLNEGNAWVRGHLRPADRRMSEMVAATSESESARWELLKHAGRELLLAQASDWPFILRTGTSPDYARQRIVHHLETFWKLETLWRVGGEQEAGRLVTDAALFPTLDPSWWRVG